MARQRTLKIGISGVRGVVGDSLTPALLVRFAQAFGTYLKGGQVAVGRDTRPSGEMVRAAVIGGLLATGCDAVDFGILPVPTLQIAVARKHLQGGVAITASHNPQEWNALKFIWTDGVLLYPHQAEELLNIYHQGAFSLLGEDGVGQASEGTGAIEEHLALIVEHTDVEAIRSAGLRVVVDCVNGAGSLLAPDLLRALGCREVIVINGEPNGLFPRRPEPRPEHLQELADVVRETGADIGFAQDADADRLALVDETGTPVSEEYTLALAAEVVASTAGPIPLVANLSTSRMIEEVGERYGCPVRRSKVGEIHVVAAMRQEAQKFRESGLTNHPAWAFGGEGNGGVIDPRIHYCRDSHRAMSLILEGLARVDKPLSEWIRTTFRPSAMAKIATPAPVSKIQQILIRLRRHYSDDGHIDDTEGIKVTWPDRSWVHVRPSNTEPVVRIIAEADTKEKAEAIAAEALEVVQAALGA